jgi:hypothetical protein
MARKSKLSPELQRLNKALKKVKSKKQHTPDYYPVQRTIPLSGTVTANGGLITGTMTGDAGRILSQVNRRIYRYGNLYQIKLDLDITQSVGVPVDVEVFALRNNWDVQRAYALAKATYDKAYEDELKQSGAGQTARWRDFRVDDGVDNAVHLYPVVTDNRTLTETVDDEGEFSLSRVDDNGTEKYFTWGDAGGTSLDIINEWTQSGRTSTDPQLYSANAPYQGVNADDISDIEKSNLGEDGNKPPYNQQASGNELYQVATMRYEPGPTGLQRLSTGYFDAPCGLFVIKVTSGVNLGMGTLHLTAKSGDYKGVHAKGMCN